MLYPVTSVTSDQYVGLYLKCTRHRLVLRSRKPIRKTYGKIKPRFKDAFLFET